MARNLTRYEMPVNLEKSLREVTPRANRFSHPGGLMNLWAWLLISAVDDLVAELNHRKLNQPGAQTLRRQNARHWISDKNERKRLLAASNSCRPHRHPHTAQAC